MQRILIRLIDGYGLGDIIQCTAILKHLARYRPNWLIDFQSKPGSETACRGVCNAIFRDDAPANVENYDSVVDVRIYDNFIGFTDRPNTKVTCCLHEKFGIPYDPDLGRYAIQVRPEVKKTVEKWLRSLDISVENGKARAAILHYQGNSSPHKKNLEHWQAEEICNTMLASGRRAILFDWMKQAPFVDNRQICRVPDELWGADAEVLAALISSVEAYIGIDSGPGHAASATDTPAMICWRLHHPVQFHDPAPNTTHLIPDTHRNIYPAESDAICEYFFDHYQSRIYKGEHGLVDQVGTWLAETLKGDVLVQPVRFVIPDDLLAACWAAEKMRGLAGGRPIEVIVGAPRGGGHAVAEFMRRFDFVQTIRIKDIPIFQSPERPQNTRGHYLYVPDGVRHYEGVIYHYLIANHAMQIGRPFEDWYPEIPTEKHHESCIQVA